MIELAAKRELEYADLKVGLRVTCARDVKDSSSHLGESGVVISVYPKADYHQCCVRFDKDSRTWYVDYHALDFE